MPEKKNFSLFRAGWPCTARAKVLVWISTWEKVSGSRRQEGGRGTKKVVCLGETNHGGELKS